MALGPVDGATITGHDNGSNQDGVYSFTTSGGIAYTVTPSLAGYTFSPASYTTPNLNSNVVVPTFTATAVGPYTASTIADLNNCIQNLTQFTTCALAPGTYDITSTIQINRSNVTVTGGSGDRTQTKLVRDPSFTDPVIRINAPTFTPPGVLLENLTVCGGLDVIRDINSTSDINLGASPVGCPRQQTTAPNFTSGSCGDMLHRITKGTEPGQPPASANDFTCEDVVIERADTGEYQPNPFPSTADYSLAIANVDLEDATGHALQLFEDGTPGSPAYINDIYIHNSAINGSAVTGILYGADNAPTYYPQVCDSNPSWLNDTSVFAPRNLRIENNQFSNNNTGAMGGGAVRWVGLRNNTFTNNYIHPQVGNTQGGTIEFDPCADQLQIADNSFYAPTALDYITDGLELYSRDIQIQGNYIGNQTGYPGYAVEGITLASVFGANVTSDNNANVTQNDDAISYPSAGGIAVSTAQSTLGPCGDPRDSKDVTISNVTSEGQLYGVFLQAHDSHSTDTFRHDLNPYAVALSGNNLANNSHNEVGQDQIVFLDSYSGPSGANESIVSTSVVPRALTVRAVSPVTSRCSTSTQPQTFAFPASDVAGISHIQKIEANFSVFGNDSDGNGGPGDPSSGSPPTRMPGCHLAYFPSTETVYLDSPNGGSTWAGGSSPVGPTGFDLSNSYCTIHAGWTPASMAQPFISTYILSQSLVIQFPPSSPRLHIYTQVEDSQSQVSDGGQWAYWGWWATQ